MVHQAQLKSAACCPPRPSRACSVCGSTASSRAGQVAIQQWTGSGVVGPIDVMGRSCAGIPGSCAESLDNQRKWLGWVVGWAGPEASFRQARFLPGLKLVSHVSSLCVARWLRAARWVSSAGGVAGCRWWGRVLAC